MWNVHTVDRDSVITRATLTYGPMSCPHWRWSQPIDITCRPLSVVAVSAEYHHSMWNVHTVDCDFAITRPTLTYGPMSCPYWRWSQPINITCRPVSVVVVSAEYHHSMWDVHAVDCDCNYQGNGNLRPNELSTLEMESANQYYLSSGVSCLSFVLSTTTVCGMYIRATVTYGPMSCPHWRLSQPINTTCRAVSVVLLSVAYHHSMWNVHTVDRDSAITRATVTYGSMSCPHWRLSQPINITCRPVSVVLLSVAYYHSMWNFHAVDLDCATPSPSVTYVLANQYHLLS
ncbi:hypothetical protein J6590_062334 [Homalodisca vitripennis]|nr:hypothetical protein J6590_062334 [Homalodisca vitripennis]